MSAAKELILVTGASGFVASHVVDALLQAGFAVRGTVRCAKVEAMQMAPISTKHPEDVSFVGIDDVATADFTVALKGVKGVIHVAPFPIGGAAETSIDLAKKGTVNVMRQALDAGITKIVMTSTSGALMSPEEALSKPYEGYTFTENDWGKAAEEDFVKNEGNMMWTYLAGKILSERVAWEFAKENPQLDLALILPPFIYGPINADYPSPPVSKLSSNQHMYSLVYGEPGRALGFQMPPSFIDVRDVAMAHVRALSVPPASDKRYLISSGFLTQKSAVEYLAKTRPELKDRLPSLADAKDMEMATVSRMDTSKAKKDLGMDKYISWEQTLDDTVTSLLGLESFWKDT